MTKEPQASPFISDKEKVRKIMHFYVDSLLDKADFDFQSFPYLSVVNPRCTYTFRSGACYDCIHDFKFNFRFLADSVESCNSKSPIRKVDNHD